MSPTEKNNWTTEDWIKKLKQQAEESKVYRHKLYHKVNLKTKKNILDIGCGTGAVTLDLAQSTKGQVIGIDIDSEKLKEAKKVLSNFSNIRLMKANVLDLPFEDEHFDLVVFNIVLMHIDSKSQDKAMSEMVRVTKKGGFILASLEPDYASMIVYPDEPTTPIVLKNFSDMGVDLKAGRKLKVLFNSVGLETEFGMDTDSEFIFYKDDKKRLDFFENDFWLFEKMLKKYGWTEKQIEEYKNEAINKIKNGLSFSFVPCFYAIGKKV